MSEFLGGQSTRIVAVVNQKGGVGKTTTAINLAAALVEAGARVLVVDLDPQGNASTGLGISPSQRSLSTYDLLVEEVSPAQVIRQTAIEGLFLCPASTDLSSADIELVSNEKRSFLLHDALREPSIDSYAIDFILIDCPPSLGLLTLNALCAADTLLVPLQCEFFALEGLSQLLQTVDQVQQRFNPALGIIGVALTMYDRRNRLTDQVSDDVRDCLGNLVFETVIPRNVRLSEAPSHGLPALIYDQHCTGSRAYMSLARELIGRFPAERQAA